MREDVPEGWPRDACQVAEDVKGKVLEALRSDGASPAPGRLVGFYDCDGNYAGASFAGLQPADLSDFTASDLLATMLLSVRIMPGATRRILLQGPVRTRLLSKLRAVPNIELSAAGNRDLQAMACLYEEVKQSLSAPATLVKNSWVTASKLCARKRPDLFPVRDTIVCDYLDLTSFENYQMDWLVFRCLMRDQEIIWAIDAIANALGDYAATRNLHIDKSRLRLLDAALWTYAKQIRRRNRRV